ncbi:recombinase family protein [Paenibacillus sp. EPM92]|uniref:recombinase family protein n=1 Tax=Paenibacillus sp. EPM92 TaxID=1561195 RepID=UPI001915B4EA|nr:recombinase family protein [Paenibacillus sp. EPM92]
MRYNVADNNGLGIPLNGGTEVKVATYVRVSTVFEEQDSSIINQEEGLQDYYRKKGWVLYETYGERGSSFKKREAFARLVKDGLNKKFQVILVKSLSRFGRNMGELTTVIPKMVEIGVRFIALTENLDTDKSDWQSKLTMYAMVYHMQSQTTSEFIRMAERARAKRGEFTGSFTPYGYRKLEKRLVFADDSTPDIVQRIFDWYQEGELGMQAIANRLNVDEVPTPGQTHGRKNGSQYWCQSTIEYILTNPVYVGDLIAQREQAATLGSNKRKAIKKEEQIMLTNNHPALISREQFQVVQDLINRRSHNKVSGMPNLFTHILFCADCGSGMHCVKRSYGKTHYMCGKYKLRGKGHCTRHSIYEHELINLILSDIKLLMNENVSSDALIQKMQKEAAIEKKAASRDITTLKKELEKLERRKKVAEDKWLDGDIEKEQYHEMLERISSELLDTQQKLSNLLKEHEDVKLTLPDIAKLVSFETLDRELLLMLVKRIEVKESGDVSVTYNFKV